MEYQPIVIGLVVAIVAYMVLSNINQKKAGGEGDSELVKATESSAASKAALFFFLVMISMVLSHLGWTMFTGNGGWGGGGAGGDGGGAAGGADGELHLPDYCVGNISESMNVGQAPF